MTVLSDGANIRRKMFAMIPNESVPKVAGRCRAVARGELEWASPRALSTMQTEANPIIAITHTYLLIAKQADPSLRTNTMSVVLCSRLAQVWRKRCVAKVAVIFDTNIADAMVSTVQVANHLFRRISHWILWCIGDACIRNYRLVGVRFVGWILYKELAMKPSIVFFARASFIWICFVALPVVDTKEILVKCTSSGTKRRGLVLAKASGKKSRAVLRLTTVALIDYLTTVQRIGQANATI